MEKPYKHWVGDGFHVYPVFADLAFKEDLSPLLMFDYAAPKQFPARASSRPLGVGQHPHRGFETVTIAFQGEVEHRDNKGNTGVIGTGDVQWMTAGRGMFRGDFVPVMGVRDLGILYLSLLKK
jgi:redox-sensitive bicupin YhaK (pirin superfamily)